MKQIKALYAKVYSSFNNHEHRSRWQGGIGLFVVVLFVFSALLFGRTVEALNQIAGIYGYYSGTYGYWGASQQTSDNIPSAPTSFASSGITTAAATVSWTAPTTTILSTSYNNAHSTTPYLIHYSTSSLSSCSGGSSTTSTSASASLTGLTSGKTYYVAVCAYDAHKNTSAALTGSFVTTSETGGNLGGPAPLSLNSAPKTPDTTVVPNSPVVTPAVGSLVTGKLGGSADAALAAVQVTGAQATAAKATAAAAATIALKGASAESASILQNALAVAASQNAEISTAVKGESAGQRLSNFLGAVVQSEALAVAKTNPGVATAIGELLVVPAATGSMQSNLRAATVARMTALGVTSAVAQDVNVKLEKREKEFVGMYLEFYKKVGPKSDAQWANYLSSAYGAKVLSRDLSAGGLEVKARVRYEGTSALNKAPFGPLKTLDAQRKGTGAAAVKAQQYYSLAWNLIQNAGSAAKTGVRLLP